MKRLLTLCMMITLAVSSAWGDEEIVNSEKTWTFNSLEGTTITSNQCVDGLYLRAYSGSSADRTFSLSSIDSQELSIGGKAVTVTKVLTGGSDINVPNSLALKTANETGNGMKPFLAFNTGVAGTCYLLIKKVNTQNSNSYRNRIYWGNGETAIASKYSQDANNTTDINEISWTSDGAGTFVVGSSAGNSSIYAVRFVPSVYAPTFSQNGNTVTITAGTCNINGAAVTTYYTIDGSDPSSSETRQSFTGASANVNLTANTTIKAVTITDGDISGAVASESFTYTAPVTITFNSAGGTDVTAITQLPGTAVSAPTAPTRDGYTFAGWYLNEEAYAFSTMPTENITLVAHWTAIDYTVQSTTHTNGSVTFCKEENGTYTETITDAHIGETIYVKAVADDNYDFSSLISSDVDNLTSAATTSFTMPAKNVDITATFTASQVAESSVSTEQTWTFNGEVGTQYKAVTEIGNGLYVRGSNGRNFTITALDQPGSVIFADGFSSEIPNTLVANNASNGSAPTSAGDTNGAIGALGLNMGVPGTLFAKVKAGGTIESGSRLRIQSNTLSTLNQKIPADNSTLYELSCSFTEETYAFLIGATCNLNVYAVRFVPATTVKVPTGLTGGTVTSDKTTANENEEVTLTVTPADGYHLKEGTLKAYYISTNGTETEVTITNNKFTKPAFYVYVKAEFEENTAPTVTTAPSAVTPTYTGEAQNLVTAGEVTGGTIQFSTTSATEGFDTAIPQGTNAGSYNVWWKVVGDETHTDVAAAQIENVTIAKATPTISTAPTASAITAGQTLASSTLSGGVASVEGTFAWTDNTITPSVSDSEITPYNVTFIPNDAANYNTATTTVNLTVTAANVVTSLAAFVGTKTFTSDATGNWTANSTNTVLYTPITNPQFMALSRADQMAINSTYGLRLGKAQANMGGALVFYVGATSDIAINIKQVQPTDTSDNPLMVDYMGTSFEALTTGNYATAGTNKASGTLTSSNTTLQLTVSGAQAGYYKVYSSTYRFGVTSLTIIPIHSVTAATSTGTDTYGTVAAESTTVAEGATTTITATPATGYQVSNWAVSGEGASISPSGDSNSNTTTLTMGTADATVTCTFELINYGDATCTTPPQAASLTYTGSAQNLVTEPEGVTGGEVQYSTTSADANDYSATIPQETNAGNYSVWWKIVGDAQHNTTEATKIDVTIAKATLTATADNKSKTVGEANPELTVTVTGFVNSETAGTAAGYMAPTATTEATTESQAGEYTITVSGGSADNYDFQYTNGTLTVSAATPVSTVPVFIVAGQSNADGRILSTNYAIPYSYSKTQISYCNGTTMKTEGSFATFDATCDASGKRWGFDAVLYGCLESALDEYYIVKQSKGSTAINTTYNATGLCWNASTDYLAANTSANAEGLSLAKALVSNVKTSVQALADQGKTADLKCLIWHQGESDRNDAANYKTNLETLMTYIRAELATIDEKYASLPIICGTISKYSKQYNATIEAAFKNNSLSNFYYIDMAKASMYAEDHQDVHFDATSATYLGKKLFNKLIELNLISATAVEVADLVEPTNVTRTYDFLSWTKDNLADASTYQRLVLDKTDTSHKDVKENNVYVIEDPEGSMDNLFLEGRFALSEYTEGASAQNDAINLRGNNGLRINSGNTAVLSILNLNPGDAVTITGKKGGDDATTLRFLSTNAFKSGNAQTATVSEGDTWTIGTSESGSETYIIKTGNQLDLTFGNTGSHHLYMVKIQPEAATIKSEYKVTATVSGPDGSGSVVVMNGEEETAYDADTEYVEGTTVTLKAKANEGYQFANWTDADNNVLTTDLDYVDAISDDQITLRMTQAVNIKAVFEVETIVKSASVVYDYATATNINTDNSVKRTLTYNNGTEETSGGFRYEREGETKQRVLSFSNTGGFTEGSGLTFGSNSRPFGIEGLKRGDVIRIIHNGTVNTSANAASTGTTITDISDNAFSEGNIASGQEIKVATADATNDYIVLQASANITISQIAINKGIKPRVNLTNIDGNVFTYSAQFYEGEVLHYTGPGINGEQTVEYTANNNGSVTITADITNGEGNLVCWTTYDDVASDEVTINVAPINDDANTGKDDDVYDFQTWVTEMGAKGTLTRGGSDITVEGSNKVKQIQNIYASGKENNFMETHGRFAINANADVGYDKNDETKRGLRTNGDGRTAYFSILNLKSGDNITINNGVTVEGKSALRFVSTNAHKKGSTTTPSGDVDNRTVWTSGDTWVMDADGRLDLMLGDADCMAYIYSIRISNRENVAAATFAKDADDENKLIITAGTTDVETATTYYTLDGTEPTTSSTAITSSPLTLVLTQDTTLITLTVGSTGKTARGYYQFTYTDTTPTAAKTFDFFNMYKNDPTFDLQMEDATKRTAYFAKKDGESMVDNSGNFYAIKASPIDSIIAWREKHVELTANGLKPTNADRPFVIRDLKKNDVIRIEFDGDIYYAKHSTRGNALKDMEPGDAITTRTAYKVASVDDTYNYVVFYPTKATTISQISINEELTPHVLPTVPSVAFSKVEEGKSVYTITYQDGETLHYQLGSDSQVDVTTASPYSLKIDKSATLSAWTSTDDGESGKLSYGVYAPTDSVYADGVYDFTKVAGTTPVEIVTAGQTVGGQTVYAPNAITSATFDRRFAFSSITGTDVRLIGGTGLRVAKGKNVYIALKNLEKDKVLAINYTTTSDDDGILFKSVSILDGATVDAKVVSGKEYNINEAGNILLQVSNANASLDISSIQLGSKMKTEQADVEYQVVNNEATVTGFTTAETASEITVPASVDGAPVTAIAEGTFTEENTANVTSIDLSETAVTFDGTTRETIDELKNINEATLIYLPSTANVTGTNVVTKGGTTDEPTYTCDDYQIKDGQESSVPHAFTAAQAKITRTFTSGVKCTVCLPYQFTASGGSFYQFTGISDGMVEMTEQTGTLDANTPYIFVPSSDATEGASASNVTVSISDAPETVDAANHFTFKGTFEKTIWDEATAEGIYGFAANAQDGAEVGQFVRVGAGASIDAYRAYLKYEGEGTLNGPNSAPRRAPVVLPVTLSIKWIPAQSGATTIRNIEVNDDGDAPAYNLSGQRVGKDYKGIVIVNGKKVRK